MRILPKEVEENQNRNTKRQKTDSQNSLNIDEKPGLILPGLL
jgi:hypothetical protein